MDDDAAPSTPGEDDPGPPTVVPVVPAPSAVAVPVVVPRVIGPVGAPGRRPGVLPVDRRKGTRVRVSVGVPGPQPVRRVAPEGAVVGQREAVVVRIVVRIPVVVPPVVGAGVGGIAVVAVARPPSSVSVGVDPVIALGVVASPSQAEAQPEEGRAWTVGAHVHPEGNTVEEGAHTHRERQVALGRRRDTDKGRYRQCGQKRFRCRLHRVLPFHESLPPFVAGLMPGALKSCKSLDERALRRYTSTLVAPSCPAWGTPAGVGWTHRPRWRSSVWTPPARAPGGRPPSPVETLGAPRRMIKRSLL